MKRAYLFAKLPITSQQYAVEKELILWRSVIDQAVQDLLSREQTSEAASRKQEARIWLRGNSEDFWTVCFLASLDPKEVTRKVEALIGGRNELFKDPGT